MIVSYGPHPVDLAVPNSAARTAIAAFISDCQDPEWRPPVSSSRRPGLYLLIDTSGSRPALLGFHVIFGSSYLKIGAAGAPERAPPYAAAFLEAATEAVWWRNFAVTPITASVWRPVVVLEWLSGLAERSSHPPPGSVTPSSTYAELESEEVGNWLLPTGDQPGRVRVRGRVPAGSHDAGTHLRVSSTLPRERSLVTIVRGHLEHTAAAHEARYFLVGPDRFPNMPTGVLGSEDPSTGEPLSGDPLPMEVWLEVGARPTPKTESPLAQHGLGPALVLAHGGIGYPLSGWLTRNLDVWPERPKDVSTGTLVRRDVRNDGIAQVQLASLVSALVFIPLLLLSLLVQMISAPSVTDTLAPVTPGVQPAISVCSADHATFVREFRCQIQTMSAGTALEVPVCGDNGSALTAGPPSADLQADYCGLLDRALDQPDLVLKQGVTVNPAELAATQACFNVLGYPDPYKLELPENNGPRVFGDPVAFLDNSELAIRPLQSLVAELEAACGAYRGRIDARVEGAVFATHLGLPANPHGDGQVAALRSSLLDRVLLDETDTDASCFRAGAADTLFAATYPEVCGPDITVLPPEGVGPIWTKLQESGGSGEGVIERYVSARFGHEPESTPRTPALWACHLDLASRARQTSFRGAWDLSIPIPHAYDVDAGAVRSQLELDAALGALRTGAQGGSCWPVVADRLAHYEPAHPLLGAFDEKADFSIEQQLCGQACAVRYHLREPAAGSWITVSEDLRLCVDRTPPSLGGDSDASVTALLVDASPQPAFDRLRLPWNGRSRAEPSARPTIEQICSFNLVAQGLLPAPEGGLLVSGVERVAWAGETTDGSRLAGGIRGAAASAAVSLSTYGGSRSQETCANVAAQCFVSLLLENVRSDPPPARYLWPVEWARSVAAVSSRTGGRGGEPRAALTPWCEIVAPYLVPNGTLPEGQLDFPCAKGVDEQRARIAATIKGIAARGGQ